MTSLCRHFSAQEIVNWRLPTGVFTPTTRRNCRQLVANSCSHRRRRRDKTVSSRRRRRCVLGITVCRAYRTYGIQVRNFGSSWRDGAAFSALVHGLRPDLVDMSVLAQNSPRANLEHAFSIAEEHLGIPRLLDVAGVKCNNLMFITRRDGLFKVFILYSRNENFCYFFMQLAVRCVST